MARPHWLAVPSGEDMVAVYPAAALRAHVTFGQVTVHCSVTDQGKLTNCAIVDENPSTVGFGAAALKLAPRFRMAKTTDDGQSVAAGTVLIPIIFRAPLP
jgi:protein TonB